MQCFCGSAESHPQPLPCLQALSPHQESEGAGAVTLARILHHLAFTIFLFIVADVVMGLVL